jgi:hypothetical protein
LSDHGCQIFLGTTYRNGKIYQITIKSVWPDWAKFCRLGANFF